MFEDGEMEVTENNEENTSLSGDEDSVLREELKLLLEVQQGLLLEASEDKDCLLYTSPSPRDKRQSRMPSSA